MDKDVRAFQGPNCAPFLRTQSQPLRDGIASGKGADGAPIAEARLARMRRFVAEADAGIEECGEFRYRGVDLTFEDRVTLKLGRRDVELLHLGRANTAGDVVAWIPDAKVLAAGDIVVHPFPFATQSYIAEWVTVLRKLDAMPFAALVPGHGPVMPDRKYLRQVAGVMDSVMAQARASYRPGMTAEELRKQIDLKAARAEFSGDNAMIAANFDYMIGELAVKRAWEELAGKWEPEGLKE
jgi:glyoxylase-like metal-dependent hydrolase (beta-lactamase superfamily II)